MEILKEIAEASTFQVSCFGGKLLIEGRILTAPEIEQIGLGSSLLAQEVLMNNNQQGLNNIDEIREKQIRKECKVLMKQNFLGF